MVIDGQGCDLAALPSAAERTALRQAQVLTLMNALNELMLIGAATLARTLAARLEALPSGALLLVSDQANYVRCQEGFALFQQLLEARGARLVISRTTPQERHERANRFTLPPRLQGVYGQAAGPAGPMTKNYRIYNRQLQLAAVLD